MYLIPRLHDSVHGLGMRHPGCDGAELTCVSEPSLLVKAASLKHTMQTAFSLITLSALGTRSRMVPNGCVYVWVRVDMCLSVSSLRNKQTNKQKTNKQTKKKTNGLAKQSQTASQQESLTK